MARPRKRTVTHVATRVAGPDHAVLTLHSSGGAKHGHCTRVCAQCPWRLDSPVGEFPAEAYRHSAPTAYDGAMTTFACHMAGAEAPATCAGFLLKNADNNIAVRLSMMTSRLDPSDIRETVPLYESYRAMAEANGVEPNDPVLSPCRSNAE
jgi:hypothetical protein